MRLVTGNFIPDLDPTIDDYYRIQYDYNSAQYHLELYDDSIVRYDGHVNEYVLRRCDCMIIVVDLHNRRSMGAVEEFTRYFRQANEDDNGTGAM